MVPKASLIVYYIRPDGEIVSDQLKIEFGDELQNFVSVLICFKVKIYLLPHSARLI